MTDTNTKQWNLTGNRDFLTPDEQRLVQGNTKQDLRGMTAHGPLAWDGGDHLWAGGNIIATWGDPPIVVVPEVATPSSSSGVTIADVRKAIADALAPVGELHATVQRLASVLDKILASQNPDHKTGG